MIIKKISTALAWCFYKIINLFSWLIILMIYATVVIFIHIGKLFNKNY